MVRLLPLLLLAAAPVPDAIADAVSRAVAAPRARAEVESVDASCAVERAEVQGSILASGRFALRLVGEACPAWAWADVRVYAKVLVADTAIRTGEPIAVREEERELRPTLRPIASLPESSVAARGIATGTVIEERHVRRAGPAAGDDVTVVLHVGALTVEQTGRLVPCRKHAACALLPSGERVMGRLSGSRLLVEKR